MKKIIISCAAAALFGQVAEGKIAGKADLAKDASLKAVDVDACNCERDPFAGGYISVGLGFSSTKDKFASDFKVSATTSAADETEGHTAADALEKVQAKSKNIYDSVDVKKEDENGLFHVTASKHLTHHKRHDGLCGGISAGWMWKFSSSWYFGLSADVNCGPSSTTSARILESSAPILQKGYGLERDGTCIGASVLTGIGLGNTYLIYGRFGLEDRRTKIIPSCASEYTKRAITPGFGIGVKRVLASTGGNVGIECSYTLNKKLRLADKNKDTMFFNYVGQIASAVAGDDYLRALLPYATNDQTIACNGGIGTIKSKRTGSWKVALTVSFPLK